MGLQYGIKEVLDVSIHSYATKKPILFIDYATMTTNEQTSQRLDLRGGQGNGKVMSFDHTKDSTLKITAPLVDLKMITILTGEDLAIGAQDVFKRETLTVDASNTVTLAATPVAGTLFVYELEGIRDYGDEIAVGSSTPNAGEYVLNGAVLTFNNSTQPEGSKVVVTYFYGSPATSKKIAVRTNKFPQAVQIYGTGLGRLQEDELDYPIHVIAYKARPQGNFTFTMEGTNATNLEMTFDLYTDVGPNGEQRLIDYVFE